MYGYQRVRSWMERSSSQKARNIIRIDRHKRRAILNVQMNERKLQVDVSLEIVKKIESQK